MKKIHCSILTMEKKIYEGEVDSAVVSTYDGQTGFLCNHAPYLAELGIGEVKVKDGGKTEYFYFF